jgi:hypothetical protein
MAGEDDVNVASPWPVLWNGHYSLGCDALQFGKMLKILYHKRDDSKHVRIEVLTAVIVS